MELRVVFTKYEPSFISRAIMWFTKRREHPERDCSHVLWKFKPVGVFRDRWAAFEAMERGIWVNLYEKSLGKQTVVAEFKVKTTPTSADVLIDWMFDEFLGENYDYAGIGLWAEWILLNKWFGTLVKWFNLKFRPGKSKQLFCSGLIVVGLHELQKIDPIGWGVEGLIPRRSNPRQLVDVLLNMKNRYEYLGGILTPSAEGEATK